jgi:GAF domain-containing protein
VGQFRLEDQVLGLINVESPQAGAFTPAHCEALKRLANIVALAIDPRRSARR